LCKKAKADLNSIRNEGYPFRFKLSKVIDIHSIHCFNKSSELARKIKREEELSNGLQTKVIAAILTLRENLSSIQTTSEKNC
jgi:hypothetical protein